ncbi:MAG: M14 family metallopeptidase [Vicinamibacterales bacterium]
MRCRARWPVLSLFALVVSAAPHAQTAPARGDDASGSSIHTPEQFFGFRMGADRELADWAALQRYVETVAAASDRVEITDAGRSTEGRRLVAVIVTAPDNLARLEEIRATAMRLSDPRTLDADAAAALVDRQPVIVAIGMSVHASEIGATQAAPELLYRLATSQDPDVLRVLREVVLIFFPSLNPDGHVLTVDWYRQWKGTEYEGSELPGLYHRYAGHDLNRDAFMLNMAETRAMADFFYRRWRPQVFLAMHQMGPYGARFFVPPNTDPIDPNYDPLIWRTAGLLGNAMAFGLEEDGRAGVLQNALYDYFSPGYEDAALVGHNTVSLLTEAAGVQVATPIRIAPDQLEAEGRGFPSHQASMAFPHPWPGGTWHLRDIVDYDLSAIHGLLDAAARYRRELVRNFYVLGARQVELGRKGGPFAFLIPPDQFDLHASQHLTQLLIDGAVDVERTLEPFRIAETLYPAGTDIVLMAQPYRAYAKTLLEVQHYPARQASSTTRDRPYDVTGWTLPLQMNVKVDRVEGYFQPPRTTRLDHVTIPPARIWGEPQVTPTARRPAASYFVIDGRGNGASIAANRLLKAGANVSWSSAALVIQGYTYAKGALIVSDAAGVRPVVEGIVQQLGLRATAAIGPSPREVRAIGRARVGLYKPWVANTDEGWTRWILEQYEFPFETITDADVKRGGLRARFDAIVLPDQGASLLVTGHAGGTMPAAYTGGLTMDGTAMLKTFVDAGGTLVALDSAGELAIDLLGAPVKDATRGVAADDFFCPGSLVRIELDDDPLTYGLPRETAGFFSFSSAYDLVPTTSTPGTSAAPTARVIGRYAQDNLLLSGWLEGERVIAGKGAVVEVRSGRGRAILIAFRAQHRAQSLATFRLLFNALHTSR